MNLQPSSKLTPLAVSENLKTVLGRSPIKKRKTTSIQNSVQKSVSGQTSEIDPVIDEMDIWGDNEVPDEDDKGSRYKNESSQRLSI